MNIYDLLKHDHQVIEALVTRLESSKSGPLRDRLVLALDAELLPHIEAEEQLLYPHLAHVAVLYDLMGGATEEHALLRKLLSNVNELLENDEKFYTKLELLKDVLEQHVESEEAEIFSEALKILSDGDAESLAVDVLAAKAAAQADIFAQRSLHRGEERERVGPGGINRVF